MEKGTVRHRILVSNLIMVVVSLGIFLGINLFITFCYSESIEQEVKTTIEQIVDANELDEIINSYIGYRNEVILLLAVDGILCIIGLISVSQIFTRKLTEHIMEPLDALAEGTERMKANNLKQEISYTGDKEFENVCNSFNEMMKSVLAEQEKNRKYEKARTDMIAGISHDIRTPLTAIKGTIKALLDGVATDPGQQQKFLEIAYRRTGDMDMLLNQLFYLSKIETGNMPIVRKEIDLSKFLQSYGRAKQDYDARDGEVIRVETPDAEANVMLDPEQFQRILDNLLENSRKYAQATPLVMDIGLKRTQNGWEICVRDNGEGVPEEKLPYIFEEFYRGDESRNKKEGNGLGLYIVKCLMEAMGGSVRAQNEEGLAIYLQFPLAEEEAENVR